MRRAVLVVASAVFALAQGAWAQEIHVPAASSPSNGVEYRSADSLAALAKTLMGEARRSDTGLAAVTMDQYPGHFTMLTVRVKSGVAELHQGNADFFVVLDGEATVLTGGRMVDPKEVSPGEIRGTRVEGGSSQVLHKGDVLHIESGVPHQTTVPPGKTFTYYVIKVAEPRQ